MKYQRLKSLIAIGLLISVIFVGVISLVRGVSYFNYETSTELNLSSTRELGFCTYLGGTDYDYFGPMAVDANGGIYLAGDTASTDFPTTDGAYDRTHNGGSIGFSQDAFVMKLSGDGQEIIYSTFIGGSDDETIYSIAVDDEDNVYVTGVTASTDFPTTEDVYDKTYNGGENDCFVAKLSPDGSELLFSTYVGGSEGEFPKGIAVGENGECYVVGNTYSSNFPVDTVNEQETCHSLGGTQDGFVFKLSQDGSQLEYSMYIGGSEGDDAYSVGLNTENQAIIVGSTGSADFPTFNALNDELGGISDCFILELMSDGQFNFSTYLGGSWRDGAFTCDIGSYGRIYVTGWTNSGDFPRVGVENPLLNGSLGIFLSVLNSSGTGLEYSCILKDSRQEEVSTYVGSIDVVSQHEVWICGGTDMEQFPVTEDALFHSGKGFLTEIDPIGDALNYSTLFKPKIGNIAVDTTGNIISCGSTSIFDLPVKNAIEPEKISPDSDSLSNLDEYQYQTDPNDPDCDDDGLLDWAEVMIYYTNPWDSDSDDDSLTDADEVNAWGTNPLAWSTDADVLSDGQEIAWGYDPEDSNDPITASDLISSAWSKSTLGYVRVNDPPAVDYVRVYVKYKDSSGWWTNYEYKGQINNVHPVYEDYYMYWTLTYGYVQMKVYVKAYNTGDVFIGSDTYYVTISSGGGGGGDPPL